MTVCVISEIDKQSHHLNFVNDYHHCVQMLLRINSVSII